MQIVRYCGMGNMQGSEMECRGGAGTLPGSGRGKWRWTRNLEYLLLCICSMPQALSVRMTKNY